MTKVEIQNKLSGICHALEPYRVSREAVTVRMMDECRLMCRRKIIDCSYNISWNGDDRSILTIVYFSTTEVGIDTYQHKFSLTDNESSQVNTDDAYDRAMKGL